MSPEEAGILLFRYADVKTPRTGENETGHGGVYGGIRECDGNWAFLCGEIDRQDCLHPDRDGASPRRSGYTAFSVRGR